LKKSDFTVGYADPMFSIQCAISVALGLQNMGAFYEKPHFQWNIFNLSCKVGVENLSTKVPKGSPLRQIWSNKPFGVCGRSGV